MYNPVQYIGDKWEGYMYAFVGDLHLGVKLPKEDFLKSLNAFLGFIKSHKEPCHAIFVCGDLFDHRLTVEEARFASFFIANLVCNFCGRDQRVHVPVYFIHGTYTHDQEQYGIFLPILSKLDNVNVFYADEAIEATLMDGKKALFLPQEYGDVNYDKFFNKQYDIIVGHGPIASQTKSPCKSAKYEIIHSAELLGKISKICVFGHYHGYTDFGNNVFYTGPWLQWKYGEDEPKVFFFCNDNYEVETVPNEFAMEFKTIEINHPEELREIMSSEIKTPHRFVINSSSDDMETYRGIVNSNKSNPNVKFQLTEVVDEDDLQLTVDEVVEAQSEAVQPVPALISYIKDKYGIDATEKLSSYENQIHKDDKKDT